MGGTTLKHNEVLKEQHMFLKENHILWYKLFDKESNKTVY